MWNFSFFINMRLFLPPLLHTRCSSRQSVQRPSSQALESQSLEDSQLCLECQLTSMRVRYTHVNTHTWKDTLTLPCTAAQLVSYTLSLLCVCVCVCSRIALHMRHSCTVVLFSWGSNRISSPSVLSCLLDTHSHTFLNTNAHTVRKQWVQRTKTDTLVCLIK